MLSVQEYCENLEKNWIKSSTEKQVCYSYPVRENAAGFYFDGFITRNDSAADFSGWKGIAYTIVRREASENTDSVRISIERAGSDALEAVFYLPPGPEGQLLTGIFCFEDFPAELVNENAFMYVNGVSLCWETHKFSVQRLKAVRAEGIYVDFKIRGLSGEPGETLRYEGIICSCMDQPAAVKIFQEYEGWESMKAVTDRDRILLNPEESAEFAVELKVSENMTPGSHETTRLKIQAAGTSVRAEHRAELVTTRRLDHPYIYHNAEGWKKVREKIRDNDFYRPAAERWIKTADEWQPRPVISSEELKRLLASTENGQPYCYDTKEETALMSCAYAYMITENIKYAEKLAAYFRYFCNKKDGYPARKRGCSQSYVQEGHFFQHMAIPYDIICDSGVLSDEDKEAVEDTFRLYMKQLDRHLCSGSISNWLISEILGAVYCALALQDMERAERFVFGNGGMISQFTHGIFTDGWWHECSVGYNTWVSSMMIHMAHSLLPFGYNLLNTHFQIPFSREVSSVYGCREREVISGMFNRKWGENLKNYVRIKDMFDAVLPFIDERGVLFGIADSDEKKLSGVHFGSTYDLAYTYFRDPAYIPVMQLTEPDPVFGHPQLYRGNEDNSGIKAAEEAVKRRSGIKNAGKAEGENAFADNIGLMMLRSRKPGRERREQIQAVIRYGSHGGAHGHFDIGDLLSVMRYHRSIYNPECCWWGYAHFMYKFYVQCSLTKNMTVVDDKMQIPAESKRILFSGSQNIQAAGVEVVTKWAYPPYGGMVYYQDGQKASKEDLRRRCRLNACTLPVAEWEGSPEYGEITDCTEDILQRRVMAVTDDYIVLFDYLEGEKEHVYDSLLQIKGFKGIEGNTFNSRHTEQFSDNILSDGQFITDCRWCDAEGVTKASFETIFTEEQAGERLNCDRSNYNEPGILKIDAYTAWPPKTTQMVGRTAVYDGWAAAGDGYTVPLAYRVIGVKECGEETVLAQGSFDAWILGREEGEVDASGCDSIVLEVIQGCRYDEAGHKVTTPQCVFWGNVSIISEDNAAAELKDIDCSRVTRDNVDEGFGYGRDYKNSRVTIIGRQYDNACPASPSDHDRPGRINISLKGMKAKALSFCIGIDAFAGDEDQKRKTYAVRTTGRIGRFVTVIEPYEKKAAVKRVVSMGENAVEVHLADGRIERVTVQGIETGKPEVEIEDGGIHG